MTSSADQQTLVTFQLGRQTYALPIEPIVQIIEMVTITPVPQVNPAVEGVINVRGKAVPVINLCRYLRLPQSPLRLHTPIILVQTADRLVGLVVDQVLDVISLPASRLTRPADILPESLGNVPILQDLVNTDAGMVLLLSLSSLLSRNGAQDLDQVVATLNSQQLEPEAV